MVEISKEVKIIIYIDMIAALIYGTMYLILPDILFAGEAYYNPHLTRLWGGVIFVLLIGAIIALKRGELETLKPVWEIAILYWIMTDILNLAAFFYMPFSPLEVIRQWINTIVVAALLVINLFFYSRAAK